MPMSKVLICDDDLTELTKIELLLKKFNYTTIATNNPHDAVFHLLSAHGPRMAILDWEMPEITGIDICKKVREQASLISVYIIMLTSKNKPEDIEHAFESGANDFVEKPFQPIELKARLTSGFRILSLEKELKTLTGLLPICSWCKKIRLEDRAWMRIEEYIEQNSYARFTHGGCPECLKKIKSTS